MIVDTEEQQSFISPHLNSEEIEQPSPIKSKQLSTINEPLKNSERVEQIKTIMHEVTAVEKSTKEQSSWNQLQQHQLNSVSWQHQIQKPQFHTKVLNDPSSLNGDILTKDLKNFNQRVQQNIISPLHSPTKDI